MEPTRTLETVNLNPGKHQTLGSIHEVPARLMLDVWQKYYGKAFSEEFPNLSECNCHEIDSLARSHIEFQTIEQMKVSFNPAETAPTVVSVGCGQCYQELIYMIKLYQANYKKMQFILIDNARDQEQIEKAVSNVKEFYNKYLSKLADAPKIEFAYFSSLAAYKESVDNGTSTKPHLLLGIDLQGESSWVKSGKSFTEDMLDYFTENKLLQKSALVVYTDRLNKNLHEYSRQLGLSMVAGHIYEKRISLKNLPEHINTCRGAIYRGQ